MFTPISELKTRKTITNPDTRHTFEIRPVAPYELWKAGVFPQGSPGLSEKEIKELLDAESPEDRAVRISKMETVLITRGLTSIKVVEKDAAEDELHVDDMNPDDRAFCLIELCILSGLTSRDNTQEDAFRPAVADGPGARIAE